MKYFLHCCMLCVYFFYLALSLSGICSWDACNAAKRVWDSHLKGQMSRFCILKICLLLIFVVASFVLLLFQTQGLKVNPKSRIWTFSTRILYLKIKVARFARNVVKRRLLINDFQTLCAPRKNLERLFKFWPLSIFRLVKIRVADATTKQESLFLIHQRSRFECCLLLKNSSNRLTEIVVVKCLLGCHSTRSKILA